MLSLRGRGWTWVYVGHLTSIAFPTLGNLLRLWDPGWERLLFCVGPSHIPRSRLSSSLTCNSEEPPLGEDSIDEDDEQMIEWVACDSCAQWHHVACVEIRSISRWTCTSLK